MLRLHRLLRGPQRDPFKVLGLTRTATKAEVKAKYRELARAHHPDTSPNGDSRRMEEVNHAYKLLMKEGGYERLHLRTGMSDPASRGPRPVGVTAETRRRAAAAAPFTADQHGAAEDGAPSSSSNQTEEDGYPDEGKESVDGEGAAPLSDEEVEKFAALDPSTERRTSNGKYLYQNRDDHSWVELDRPLLRAQHSQYASHAAQADMAAELRRRAMEKEKEMNERSNFERVATRLADSAELPFQNKRLLQLYGVIVVITLYVLAMKTVARSRHQKRRTRFYRSLDEERDEQLAVFESNHVGMEVAVVAAALVFLAASEKKSLADPVVPAVPEVFFSAVQPPPTHFHVISSC